MRSLPESLETAIGHRFANRAILERALTHSSKVHEQALPGAEPGVEPDAARDNEQLEFLGDAVLGFIISEALVERFPGYPEGRLSKLKAHFVSSAYLYDVAQRLELGQYLELGRGEELSGGREKKTLLVDALEAVIAAVYLDGSMEAARRFVHAWVLDGDPEALGRAAPLVDFKSALQELAQARKLPQPRYTIVKERGPDHLKTFTVEVRMGREWTGQAEGMTKKAAAQQAARQVYERLQEIQPPAESL